MRFEPVAIVGQSCVLPGALDPKALWSAVVAGRDLVSSVPDGRWRIDPQLVSGGPDGAADQTWSDRGGFVNGFQPIFDPEGFALPAEEILPLDSLFHWVLHGTREALRDAGHDTGRPAPRAGLVIGNLSFPTPSLARLAEATWLDRLGPEFLGGRARALAGVGWPDARNRFTSGLPALMAARALRLGAGAFALDAACASSLYAIKLACDSLHDRRADLMVAGGVSGADDLFLRIGFCALQALSRSGRSLPFHRDADGLLPAEGAAMVVLKRLADSVTAGDRILGVIRGIGLSNDGRGAGFLVPHEDGQRRAMEAAYHAAGLAPSEVSLLECHATGTPVGDGAEVRSTSAVFAGLEALPVGSLKANLGHLFAAAGAAGLLKVIGALGAQTLPPTPHADDPHPSLTGSPLRLLATAEPWDVRGRRRAAVSAFGFGGNNAHLVIEEWQPAEPTLFAVAAPARDSAPVAIVGMGVLAADGTCTSDFLRALFRGESRLRAGPDGAMVARAPDVALELDGLRTPPRGLERALAQQCLVLKAAQEACAEVPGLPPDRTSVLVGMQCDAAVALHGVRVRLAEWVRAWQSWRGLPIAPEWLREAQDAIIPSADAAAVVGMLPNMPANRLNSLLGLTAPGFTVSAEELSGVVALSLAARALQAGEIDAALVGAVDVGCEPVHAHAAACVLDAERATPGDAAVVLVLKRLDDARRDGDNVHAVLQLSAEDADGAECESDREPSLVPLFGHAHAAAGLLQVAAAAAACRHRARPGGGGAQATPWLPSRQDRRRRVHVTGMADTTAAVSLAIDEASPAEPVLLEAPPQFHVFSGADRGGALEALRAGRESDAGPARLVVVAATESERAERCAMARRLLEGGGAAALPPGIAFHERPADGELAFVFTGPAGAYRGMGRELLLAMPELVGPIAATFRGVDESAGWAYAARDAEPAPAEKLWGASLLCQTHAALTRTVLGLRPQAAIGMCSGETNALFALGAWSDLDALQRDIEEAGVYTRVLAGEFEAVREAWGITGPVEWSNWRVLAPLATARAALDGETRAHLMIVNAPDDCVIGGERAACRRVVERLGAARARPLAYEMAIHCPEIATFREGWRRLHHRPTRRVDGVRFYTHATLAPYVPTPEGAADALTGQALGTVDFPAMIERAWEDGVRVFLEHGPQGGCTRWIGKILAGREHVAAALDLAGESSLRQAANAVGELLAAGVPVDRGAFEGRLTRAARARGARASATVVVPAHRSSDLPSHLAALGAECQLMASAPPLAPVAEAVDDAVERPPRSPDPRPSVATAALPLPLAAVVDHHQRVADAHRLFIAGQAEVHQRFLEGRALAPRAAAIAAPPGEWPGTHFSRAQLEVLASGRISSVLGPRFAGQDGYRRQVRLPEPPLLLTDRVLGIQAEPLSMATGTIRTETDVRWDSWYLHDGRMPAGLMIEAGQSDLLLISWLGVDLHNRGQRVYRLLGSEITFHGQPAKPGETLRFDISCEGHARQDDVRLFFFRSEGHVGGQRRLTVRHGQAGFFSDEELAASGGVLWEPETSPPGPAIRLDPPAVPAMRARFTAEEVRAFSEGRLRACFGDGYELAETHVRTPRIPPGNLLLLGEVKHLDARGGPWGRGYLRAERRIAPDDWFFRGHFKDDPCMPGTLMFEGCLQAMAFYLTAMGFTLERDGWRFEPVPERPVHLRCRGQVTPRSRALVYELFVEEVSAGPTPTLLAQVLCTVDGLKACHCRGVGLQLVPDWPLTSRPEWLAGHADRGPVAERDGFRFGYASLLACAWGAPSESFGPIYEAFDGRRLPRLPGPPYHFISRVTRIDGPIGVVRGGTAIESEYDVPKDAWYFAENGHPTMPWCVFLEVGLQPCGWLAMATGVAREWEEEVRFRNLDGTATWTREVGPGAGILATRVRLTEVSRSAGVVLVSFEAEHRLDGEVVCRMEAVFGFFPAAAFVDQPGLPPTEEEKGWLERPSEFQVDLAARPDRYFRGTPRLPGPQLLMLDRVTGYWPGAGRAGLGRLRAEKRVDPAEWFFKAHFLQDPVQPGSLGLEAMVQLLQFYVIERGLAEGLPRPRFAPLDTGRRLCWKYRGQVVPANRIVVVEIEITEEGRDEEGAYAVADAWLWVDGKRIYAASNLGTRVRPGQAPPEQALDPRPASVPPNVGKVVATEAGAGGLDATGARAFWRRRLGTGPGLPEDLLDGLATRFVGRVVVEDPPAFDAIHGRASLFLANHQVGIESLLFSALVPGLHGRVLVALAKAEHRESWLGRLARDMALYPGAADPRNLVFFDRGDTASLIPILDELRARMMTGDVSLVVHVEGTRARAAGRPVSRMSGVWVDLAVSTGAAIVPVRFTGGLPLAEVAERLEFPVGFGRQDYHLGRPLLPDELRPLDFAARQRRVLDAINALGPREEQPSPPDPGFAAEAEDWCRRTGAGAEDAVLLRSLARLGSSSEESRALLEGARQGRWTITATDGERRRWLVEMAQRLYGPRGPKVVA